MVGEAMKAQAALGERGRLVHRRDSRGSEADLIIDVGGRITVIEIKSGRIYQGERMQGVRSVLARIPDPAPPAASPSPAPAPAGRRRGRRHRQPVFPDVELHGDTLTLHA